MIMDASTSNALSTLFTCSNVKGTLEVAVASEIRLQKVMHDVCLIHFKQQYETEEIFRC
jgi:hypothetical protein